MVNPSDMVVQEHAGNHHHDAHNPTVGHRISKVQNRCPDKQRPLQRIRNTLTNGAHASHSTVCRDGLQMIKNGVDYQKLRERQSIMQRSLIILNGAHSIRQNILHILRDVRRPLPKQNGDILYHERRLQTQRGDRRVELELRGFQMHKHFFGHDVLHAIGAVVHHRGDEPDGVESQFAGAAQDKPRDYGYQREHHRRCGAFL